jgi:hypothetical protein
MKPLWTHTLAWLAAALVAVLLAFATPGGLGIPLFDDSPFVPGTGGQR